jgi:hypothetical protein
MTAGMLGLTSVSGTTARKPGERIELKAAWSLAKIPRSLEARLIWFTRGKGTQDISVVASQPISAARERDEERVMFTLPAAPYSFSGRLISLVWAVELVADDAEAERWEFVLGPEGKEILLEAIPDAPRLR